MRKEMSCDKCNGTGRLTNKELPFEVGDRVVVDHFPGKIAGTVIMPRLVGSIRTDDGNRFMDAYIYAIKFDDGVYQHLGESALEFEED